MHQFVLLVNVNPDGHSTTPISKGHMLSENLNISTFVGSAEKTLW